MPQMTFDEFWQGMRLGIESAKDARRIKAMCRAAWLACADNQLKGSPLTRWEAMAGAGTGGSDPLMNVDELGRILRNEPPQDVEELIKRLNTRGGVCYLEHANMIRAFFRRRP